MADSVIPTGNNWECDTPNPFTAVDLEALLDGMIAAIKTQFPKLLTVQDYFLVQDLVPVPAVALEITGIESDGNGDCGTEQWAAAINLSAYCIVSYKQKSGKSGLRSAVSLAGAMAAFIKTQTWGCPVQAADDIHVVPDFFWKKTKEKEYYVYRVNWQHRCIFGYGVWLGLEDDTEEEAPAATAVTFEGKLCSRD